MSNVKLCECGCGEAAPIMPYSHAKAGWVKGQPYRFVRGHNARGKARRIELQQSKECETCGQTFHAPHGADLSSWARARFCSLDCVGWKRQVARVIAGASVRRSDGYVRVYLPMHPSAKKSYVYEHRLVAELKIGRLLLPGEVVHHKNEIVHDNRPENLEVLTHRDHRAHHGSGITDAEIREMLVQGTRPTDIKNLGVSGHRVARIRRELCLV